MSGHAHRSYTHHSQTPPPPLPPSQHRQQPQRRATHNGSTAATAAVSASSSSTSSSSAPPQRHDRQPHQSSSRASSTATRLEPPVAAAAMPSSSSSTPAMASVQPGSSALKDHAVNVIRNVVYLVQTAQTILEINNSIESCSKQLAQLRSLKSVNKDVEADLVEQLRKLNDRLDKATDDKKSREEYALKGLMSLCAPAPTTASKPTSHASNGSQDAKFPLSSRDSTPSVSVANSEKQASDMVKAVLRLLLAGPEREQLESSINRDMAKKVEKSVAELFRKLKVEMQDQAQKVVDRLDKVESLVSRLDEKHEALAKHVTASSRPSLQDGATVETSATRMAAASQQLEEQGRKYRELEEQMDQLKRTMASVQADVGQMMAMPDRIKLALQSLGSQMDELQETVDTLVHKAHLANNHQGVHARAEDEAAASYSGMTAAHMSHFSDLWLANLDRMDSKIWDELKSLQRVILRRGTRLSPEPSCGPGPASDLAPFDSDSQSADMIVDQTPAANATKEASTATAPEETPDSETHKRRRLCNDSSAAFATPETPATTRLPDGPGAPVTNQPGT
ncbi:hypothetical protein BC831DRAFT_481261 [Entophlyctis helioformis]|nr:hypothetical protein BC831DRAFT_481261 [Entophlyctis helioformis]